MPTNTLADNINNLINEQYNKSTDKIKELEQLAKLFSKDFIDGLAKLLFESRSSTTKALDSVSVEFTWIDKRPYVKQAGNKTKGELGDALFIVNKNYLRNSQLVCSSEKKAFIFQAKKSNTIKFPKVPFGKITNPENTIAKEFNLLSKWPQFDLIKGRETYLSQVDIRAKKINHLQHGWYGACAKTIPRDNTWPSHWMCAQAELKKDCKYTLGEVLARLYDGGNIDSIPIGRDFSTLQYINKNKGGWDELVTTVLKIINEAKTPSSLKQYSYNSGYVKSPIMKVAATQYTLRNKNNSIANQYISLEENVRALFPYIPKIFYQFVEDIKQGFPLNELFYWYDIFFNMDIYVTCNNYPEVLIELCNVITAIENELKVRNIYHKIEPGLLFSMVENYYANKNLIPSGLLNKPITSDIDIPKNAKFFVLIVNFNINENRD